MFKPQPLGVGMVYFPALEPFFDGHGGLLDVLEVEPQTLWLRSTAALDPASDPPEPRSAHRLDERAFAALARWRQAKLLHGVGMPLASSVPSDPRQHPPWRDSIARLQPHWVSEHLAFQRVPQPRLAQTQGATDVHGGFLLPACQVDETVSLAVHRIAQLQHLSGRPVAFETSPNYLRRDRTQLDDGTFYAQVAVRANCGILLDLHNLWCNERNGRQSMQEVMARLPLERVWEVHLAGGEARDGYWLDAHSGLVPDELMDFCARWLPKLVNLGALVYEVIPDYVQARGMSHEALADQLCALQGLWRHRDRVFVAGGIRTEPVQLPDRLDPAAAPGHNANAPYSEGPAPADRAPGHLATSPPPVLTSAQWEQALGALVNGRHAPNTPRVLVDDPGIEVLRTLVESFRVGTLTAGLTLSWRLLVLRIGEGATAQLMKDFWRNHWPEPFAFDELCSFARFTQARLDAGELDVPHLGSVMAYELGVARAQQTGQEIWTRFDCDPVPLLSALARGQSPGPLVSGSFELRAGP